MGAAEVLLIYTHFGPWLGARRLGKQRAEEGGFLKTAAERPRGSRKFVPNVPRAPPFPTNLSSLHLLLGAHALRRWQ